MQHRRQWYKGVFCRYELEKPQVVERVLSIKGLASLRSLQPGPAAYERGVTGADAS